MAILSAMIQRGSSPHLVGRADEFAVLQDAFARAVAGEPTAVLIGGDAGIGKSRLVKELSDEAETAGAEVLWGACVATGGLSYAPISQALRSLLRRRSGRRWDELVGDSRDLLARLVPELAEPTPEGLDRAGDDATGQRRLFAHVLGLVERIAEDGPLVLVLEDLHWADASTRDLMGFLARNLSRSSTMLVGTYRTEHLRRGDPLRQLLLELDHSGLVERIELLPLDDAAVGELLTGVLGVPPAAAVVEDIARRAQGNPLFCEELLTARRAGHERLPPTLRDLLSHRIDELAAPGRRILEVAAVLGDRSHHRLLAAVSDTDGDTLLAGVREAIDNQLLVSGGNGHTYAFRHRLVLEAIYDEVPPGDRLRWHTAAAETLEREPDLAADAIAARAHHWDAADEPARAVPAHVAAGERAESMYGFAEAHRHLSRAAELWERIDDPATLDDLAPLERLDLLERAGRAANHVGEHEAAIELLTGALHELEGRPRTIGLRAPLVWQQLGESRLRAGQLEEGAEQILRGLAALPDGAPPALRAELLATAGLTQALLQAGAEGVAWCEEAIELATSAGAPAAEARARCGLGLAAMQRGDGDTALAELHGARRAATRSDDAEELLRACVNTQAALAHLGRFEESLLAGEEGLTLLERFGRDRQQHALLRCNQAEVHFALGRWDEVRATLSSLRVGRGYVGAYAQELRATLAVAEGRFADAEIALAAIQQVVPGIPLGRVAAAELAFARDDPQAAERALQGAVDVCSMGDAHLVSAQLRWLSVRAAADGVEAASARRQGDRVRQHRATAEALASVASADAAGALPPMRAYAALTGAELTRARQQPDPGAWEAAVTGWDALDHPYRAAYARWRRAEALTLTQRDPHTLQRVLQEAHATTSALGARPLREAIEASAARAGLRLPAAPQPETGATPDPLDELGLTAREREVLRLLGAGRTNQQISEQLVIARKTASVHVSNILRKLDVSNRAEAAAVAHRLGAVHEPESEARRR